jgi:superfamily II DNA/RNA helicase
VDFAPSVTQKSRLSGLLWQFYTGGDPVGQLRNTLLDNSPPLQMSVFFDPKINNPQNPGDKKLIIFTEAIPTARMLVDNLDTETYEGKVLAINAANLADNRETVNANYEGVKRNDYQILITTDVLVEGVNLHRSNVILNYDSPWNSIRLMQRLGRINRIGSDADCINVYNFYPSAQRDAEINIVERAWNKLQAFHELFGEDSKIFSREEELVIHDLIQHDEDEGSQSLKYIGLLKRFREQNGGRSVRRRRGSGCPGCLW